MTFVDGRPERVVFVTPLSTCSLHPFFAGRKEVCARGLFGIDLPSCRGLIQSSSFEITSFD